MRWNRFFCAAIAALTLRVLDPYGHGRLVLLEVNYSKDHHSNFIYLIAVFLGVIGVNCYVPNLIYKLTKSVRGSTAPCGHG